MLFTSDSPVILEDMRVRIEPMDWKHFEKLLPIALEYPQLIKYSPAKFGSEESLKEYFNNSLKQKESKHRYPFVIFDKRTQSYAGSTSYLNISDKDKRLEIGSTWISPFFQRTGLNRHCKYLLLKFAFEDLKYERVEFRTDSRNEQSQKAIEAIGGKFEGMLRSHTVMTDGYRRNTVCYSILKDEWWVIKDTIFGKISEEGKQII